MKNKLILLGALLSVSVVASTSLKILHLSFHRGCINDFKAVARELNLEVTSWYVLESLESKIRFEGQDYGNRSYNMSHDRAARVWELNKDYFDQFDVIFTSDTAPLARIFLQNGWQKPLVIWVCNRFDYAHDASDPFPDPEFYELFKKACTQKNVTIIPYTEYERVYAAQKGVYFTHEVIKPFGDKSSPSAHSRIPSFIIKSDTFFIYPRLDEPTIDAMIQTCSWHGIKVHSGIYAGPTDIADFKGIIYVPYAWSNVAVFENFHHGIIHFVPTPDFAKNFTVFPSFAHYQLCEWYSGEYRNLFVFFNSWQDFKEKVATTNYGEMRKLIREAGRKHHEKVLAQWRTLFQGLPA